MFASIHDLTRTATMSTTSVRSAPTADCKARIDGAALAALARGHIGFNGLMNALKPAEITSMDLDYDVNKANVYVKPDQQSLAIGKKGQNVRLASKLSKWAATARCLSRRSWRLSASPGTTRRFPGFRRRPASAAASAGPADRSCSGIARHRRRSPSLPVRSTGRPSLLIMRSYSTSPDRIRLPSKSAGFTCRAE